MVVVVVHGACLGNTVSEVWLVPSNAWCALSCGCSYKERANFCIGHSNAQGLGNRLEEGIDGCKVAGSLWRRDGGLLGDGQLGAGGCVGEDIVDLCYICTPVVSSMKHVVRRTESAAPPFKPYVRRECTKAPQARRLVLVAQSHQGTCH